MHDYKHEAECAICDDGHQVSCEHWCKTSRCTYSCRNLAKLFLRLGLGTSFLYNGIVQWFALTRLSEGLFAVFGGLPSWALFVILIVQMAASLCLLLGVFNKYAAYALAALSVLALVISLNLGADFSIVQGHLLLIFASLSSAWLGAGRWSISARCTCCKNVR